jgi:energy-converting hydrogenase Eha subunit H
VAEPATRSTRSGPGRVLVAVYAVFAISSLGRSSVQLLTKADEAPVPYALSGLAALVYVAATLGLAEAVPGSRRLAWVAVVVELVGVLVVGTVSVVRPEWFEDATVWSSFGQGYGYLPAVLPLLGIAWLVSSRRPPPPAAPRPSA